VVRASHEAHLAAAARFDVVERRLNRRRPIHCAIVGADKCDLRHQKLFVDYRETGTMPHRELNPSRAPRPGKFESWVTLLKKE